jgi:amidohydrolase
MDFKQIASNAIDSEKDELIKLSNEIWQNPEIGLEEYKAVANLTSFLQARGFIITSPYCGLETAFRADMHGENDDGAPHVCVICEYDALPGIGHACGHNLIAEAGVAAGLGLRAAIEGGLVGRVTIMGTPAEETVGGKVLMVQRGAFDGIDAAMMIHPGPCNILTPTYDALSELFITYTTKGDINRIDRLWGGAGGSSNPLDAAVMAVTSLSMLRQQFKPSWQIHGVITDGGVNPDVIPRQTKLHYFFRAPTSGELLTIRERAYDCFTGAAIATGCTVTFENNPFTDNLITNSVLREVYTANNEKCCGVREYHEPLEMMGSTDMGNVSHAVPSIHPEYVIGTGEEHYHTRVFTSVTNTMESHERTLLGAKSMAHTLIDVMADPHLLNRVKEQFIKDKQCS